eukprot:7156913-Prymnesium_polylepis.1
MTRREFRDSALGEADGLILGATPPARCRRRGTGRGVRALMSLAARHVDSSRAASCKSREQEGKRYDTSPA